VASTYAGVGVVTPQVQAEALRLWERFCGPRSEGGNDGGVSVHCKVATEDVRDVQQHTLNIPSSQAGQQVVFVQPPSVHTKHDVVVTGGGGAAPKTVIYVKPAKNTNEVNILDQTQPATAPQKPSLYFLKEDHGGSSQAFRTADKVTGTSFGGSSQGFRPADEVTGTSFGGSSKDFRRADEVTGTGFGGSSQDFRTADQVTGKSFDVSSQDFRPADEVTGTGFGGSIQDFSADARLSSIGNDGVVFNSRNGDRFTPSGNLRRVRIFRSGGRTSRQVIYVPRA
jgi:hypothetical protein